MGHISTRVAWAGRAPELADWSIARLFARTDRFGGYYTGKDGGTAKSARPNRGCKDVLSRSVLLRHFAAARPEDVVGAYALTPGEAGTGRWVAVDIDAHGPADVAGRNERYAVHLHRELAALGFRPLLATWGAGGYHLWVLFDRDVPGPVLHAFGKWVVRDAAAFGFAGPVESFPKQRVVPDGKYGNWLRVIGRHHTRDVFASVYDGGRWADGDAAVAHVLATAGDSPERIPAAARPAAPAVKKTTAGRPSARTGGRSGVVSDGGDVFAAYNRTVTLDRVAAWHEARGHRTVRREPDRVEFVRAGKDGAGQSFNVRVVGGVPVTYNFSPNAGLPDGRGLSPAQVRCAYETGACDRAAMARFADVLRREGSLGGTASADGTQVTPTQPEPQPPDAGPTTTGVVEQFTDTDLANAGRFVGDNRGRAKYVADWKRWVVFDGRRWVIDQTGAVVAGLAQGTLRRMAAEAARHVGEAARHLATAPADEVTSAREALDEASKALAWAKKSQDARRMDAMVTMARPRLLVPFGAEVFDRDPDVLNCVNGTVDLRTGEISPHSRLDHITKLCPTRYVRGAPAPAYHKFLADAFGPDGLAGYVRDFSGYAVTGGVGEQLLHLFHGRGSNGKGVLLDLWVDVLGDGEYAATAPSELVADLGNDRHPTEKTVLRGARLAVCQESGDGERLNAKRVKGLTGGSRIVARGMRQDFFSFPPTHKLVLATNHLPRVPVNDHATWRRLRVVEFGNTFWTEADRKANPGGEFPDGRRADPALPERLRDEAEGVLADMVAHAVKFYAGGSRLPPPDRVVRAVAGYRGGEDVIGRFFDDQAEPDRTGRGIRGGDFYALFRQWFKLEIDPTEADCPRARTFYDAAADRYGPPRKVCGYMTYAAKLAARVVAAEVAAGEDGEGGGVKTC